MMKHILTISLCFLTLSLNAQVLVEQPFTLEEYVSEVLFDNGVIADNITYTGSEEQIGYLTGGDGVFSVTSGLVLSTDHATHLSDPGCIDSELCINCEGLGNDQDLLDVANSVPPLIGQSFSISSVNDLCILEFDFIAISDSISFNYVFGSDEYLEWVNSSYNDIFAFFLSGPGISGPFSAPAGFPDGAINIAEVPESYPTLPVTISSVNDITNPEYYVDNVANNNICIDGYTQTFTAAASVQCGEIYHIKLAIADGSDTALESFVLIEEISFFPECDCDGLVIDECGVCGGNGIADGDCDCFGNQLDECGVCGGSGIPEGDCDCFGNQLDALGVCGGDCTTDADADGVCDDSEVIGCGDFDFGDVGFGLSPDPSLGEGFVSGFVGQDYFDVLHILIPTFASDIDDTYPPTLPIDSIDFISVVLTDANTLIEYSPDDIGLEIVCNNNGDSPEPCMFMGGSQYCISIEGTPNIPGEFTIDFLALAWLTIFEPFSAEAEFSNFILNIQCDLIESVATVDADTELGTLGSIDVTLNSGVVPTSFLWTNENGDVVGTEEDLLDIGPGNYDLTIVADNCISIYENIIVGDLSCILTADYAITNEIENISLGMIDVTVIGANGVASFVWTNAEGLQIGTDEDLIDVSEGVYNLTVTDENDCMIVLSDITVLSTVPGCTNANACNYNPSSLIDDGSCVFPELGYDCFGDCISDVDNDGICDELEIIGCTDLEAFNYNPEATDSDNTLCIYFVPDCNNFGDPGWLDTESGTYSEQSSGVFGEMYNEDIALHLSTTIVEAGSGLSYTLESFDFASMSGLPDGLISTMTGEQMTPNSEVCVNISGIPIETGVFDILFTGEAFINVFGNSINIGVISFTHTLEIGDNPNPISGCTYPGSDNYLVYAMVDDGTCIISGCTDPEASNFHPIFNLEDGSCQYVEDVSDCIEDLNQDGTIGTPDLLQLLSAYGQICE